MFSYRLIDGGYEVLQDDTTIIYQPHSPTRGLNIFLEVQESERLAKLCIAKLQLGNDPLIEYAEEIELLGEVSDTRITELAQLYKDKLDTSKEQARNSEIAQLWERIRILEAGE